MENKKKKLTVNLQKQNKSDTEQIVLDENKQAVFCEINEEHFIFKKEELSMNQIIDRYSHLLSEEDKNKLLNI